MANPFVTTQVNVTMLDYSNERSTFGLNLEPILADGSNHPRVTGDIPASAPIHQWAEIRLALGAFTLCNFDKVRFVTQGYSYTPTPPSNQNAQREKVYRFQFRDNVTFKPFAFNLPGADLSRLAPMSDYVDQTTTVFTALRTVLELYLKSPDGNGVDLLHVKYDGKRG